MEEILFHFNDLTSTPQGSLIVMVSILLGGFIYWKRQNRNGNGNVTRHEFDLAREHNNSEHEKLSDKLEDLQKELTRGFDDVKDRLGNEREAVALLKEIRDTMPKNKEPSCPPEKNPANYF